MKYTKYLAILAAAFMMGSCSDDFLDKEPSENASEDQIKDLLDKDPTAIQAYITGYYKNMFSPEAQQSHDDFGLKAFELATDLMGDDMAYMTSHFFVYDYLLDNRASSYRRTTTYWQELYAVISGANEVISGLKEQADSGDESVEKMLGQSYTIRAYCYFWLINMYQQPYEWNKDKLGIPIYTESETKLNRVPVSEVYEQILSDIDKGYNYLKGKGIAKKDELNEYAAAAIYANILSFVNDYPDQWNEVAKYAKLAIEGGSLMSEKELLSGFNDLSLSEVLWGADINGETNTFYASFMSQVDPYGPGYGGNLGKPQGIPFIIECLKKQKKNSDAYFLIVGGGTEFEKLQEFFNTEKPENMKLMSKLPKDDYDRMVAACDVGLIFLDHRFTIPNFPSRLLSYMQAKLPVLAATDPNTDIGEVIFQGGFGWWCESNDTEAFSELVKKALEADLNEMKTNETKYLMENYTANMIYKNINKSIGWK